MSQGPELHVTGGAGGLAARYEDMEAMARLTDDVSAELLALSGWCHQLLVHDDVLASAVLHPEGVARFEAALLGALDDSDGLTTVAADIGLRAGKLRASAAAYRITDEAQAELLDLTRWFAGAWVGVTFPVSAPLLTTAGLGAVLAGEALDVDWQRLLTDHPGVIDTIVGATPGLVSGLAGLPVVADVPAGARLLGLLYPDGEARVKSLGVDDSDEPAMTEPPQGFSDLMAGLDYRNRKAHGRDQGQIDVRIVEKVLPDGTVQRSYIVDIPGTKDWHPVPLQENKHLNDLGTNLHAMAGDPTAYQQGIAEALRRAGARPGDPVMLVGHSQGGMVAVRAANDFVRSGEFNVTHVVTAGSPVGRMEVPDRVRVLSLDNEHDVVPHLDAADNPDAPNRTTVTFSDQEGTIGDNHDIEKAYLPAAGALDSSDDPSVRAYRESAQRFFSGDRVETQVYQVTRKHE
ncbi:hypothetical protein TH66_20535 [Carbonactinospora thermoautotrophica]|uniref:Fungal lipase-type domain-containing protein n=1 Tax=Carbonactinospora thermoautotrophica TaxID=1469144 RepID=A0A132NJG7_9ACTN|nr:alpha/beta hydrolase [Carbonactinospora thermoautotrophica]KWW97826.1 hypothetical protein TH66_20535 [Carbonactinospora thermoautotrophica]KWW98440.1 hypothetical protein LI90_60 [Carbonactinospora thermoautotrophica]KWX10077.1 hypothetical protein TR74_05785 [Carbonactinospora thermoautotrophica]